MRILIAGAGRVGLALARYLRSENHDIVLLDEVPERLKDIEDKIDIQTVLGSATSPSVLKSAGAENADIFLAVTDFDEVNIVSSLIAKTLFHIPKRIVRLGTPDYLDKKYEAFLKSLAIEVVLSPEEETARQTIQMLGVTGATDVAYLADGQIAFVCLQCLKKSFLNTLTEESLQKITTGTEFKLLAVRRRGKVLFHPGTISAGDEVFFTVKTSELEGILQTLGYQYLPLKSVVILGGGKVGRSLAKKLEESGVKGVTLIEKNKRVAISLASELEKTLIIEGDGLDEALQEEIDLPTYQFAVSTTRSDENNVLFSLVATRLGVQRTCAVVRHPVYGTLLSGLGIDATVDPSATMVSAVLKHVRKGWVKNDYFIQSGLGEILEIEVLRTARITEKPLKSIRFPEGVQLVAALRGGKILNLTPKTVLEPKDIAIVFVQQGKASILEKYFSVSFSFFK